MSSVSASQAHVAVFLDLESLRRAGVEATADALARATLRYVAGAGRVTLARAYGDFSARADDAKALAAARVNPVLVLPGGAGEDRASVRLTVDALEALFTGGEPDAVVLVVGDARLLPLVQALRADGSHAIVVAPAAAALDDLRAEADVVATVEDVLAGAVASPCEPRAVEDDEPEAEPAPRPAPPRAAPTFAPPPAPPRAPAFGPPGRGFERRERPAFGRERGGFEGRDRGGFEGRDRGGFEGRDRGGFEGRERGFREPAPLDFGTYDWAPFVRLMDDLEHRLPFVGVRYLVNKVLAPRNCGLDDPRQKRDLLNKAVDDGLLEMYEVGNLEGRGDPVTACRLDRQNPSVVAILGATPKPTVPEAVSTPSEPLPPADAADPLDDDRAPGGADPTHDDA